jgi:hypothetical protein
VELVEQDTCVILFNATGLATPERSDKTIPYPPVAAPYSLTSNHIDLYWYSEFGKAHLPILMRRYYAFWQYLHGSVQDQLQWLFSDSTNRGLLPAFVLAFPNLETMSNEALLQVMMVLVVPRDRRQYILSVLAAYKANPYRAPGEGPFNFQNRKAELAAVLAYLHYIKVLLTMLDMVGGWAHSLRKC